MSRELGPLVIWGEGCPESPQRQPWKRRTCEPLPAPGSPGSPQHSPARTAHLPSPLWSSPPCYQRLVASGGREHSFPGGCSLSLLHSFGILMTELRLFCDIMKLQGFKFLGAYPSFYLGGWKKTTTLNRLKGKIKIKHTVACHVYTPWVQLFQCTDYTISYYTLIMCSVLR